MKKMTIEDKLGLDIFHTDEEHSHIDVDKTYTDEKEIKKLLLACPAECYKYINGSLSFSHLGCLECGTCRVLSLGKIVKSWEHPVGEIGVSYRYG
ncbi:ferredoxin family protein [Treponema pedis]|uniref:Ferredoxin like protein n=1 Tax=Treponema pedis str. T A4 TaxID=1291379 RepID=S5ZU79_9SPIR|nr:ferredoxin family protein [Treponema pedis]AGT43735.1 ferredoxin like protein [Treponema pedis str. T A4]QSI04501.1 ferredoxin family protein [Treponema pedis]